MRFCLIIGFITLHIGIAGAYPGLIQDHADTTKHIMPADTLKKAVVDTVKAKRDTLKTRRDTTRHPGIANPANLRPGEQNGVKKPAKPLYKVVPLDYAEEPGFSLISTDSLQRWHYWESPLDWESRLHGTIAYRLGGMGRNNGMMIKGHEDRFNEVYLDDYPMNDPVGGSFNYSLLPQYFIGKWYQDTHGINVVSKFRTQDFFVDKPLTRVDYSSTSGGYKTLDALLTRNIGQRINLVGVYWTRGADGNYANSTFSGSQALGRVTYQVSHKTVWKTSLLYNGLNLQEPDGYRITDMSSFLFDPLNSESNRGGGSGAPAKSSVVNTLVRSTIYIRMDTLHKANLELGGYYNTYRRYFKAGKDSVFNQLGTYNYFLADTTYYKVHNLGAYARKAFDIGPTLLDLRADANRFRVDNASNNVLAKELWTTYKLEGDNEWKFLKYSSLNIKANETYRSDHFSEWSAQAGLKLPMFNTVTLSGSIASGSHMPTIQELYWKSPLFKGDQNLVNERVERAEVGLKLDLTKTTNLGVNVYGSVHHRPIVLAIDSTFSNIGRYQSLGSDAWFSLNSFHWELDLSTTIQQFTSTDTRIENQLLDHSGYHIWNRMGAYWKGEALSGATFIKIGFYGLMSPLSYHAAHYYPSLNLWQFVNKDQEIPPFYRVDLDLSARVRWFFLYFRLENVLDGIGQAGYYETADYPMPSRRMIFGIRVIFRN